MIKLTTMLLLLLVVITSCKKELLVVQKMDIHTTDSTAIACGSFTWDRNGKTYTTSGNYDYIVNNTDTVKLHLTISNGTHKDTTATCARYFNWDRNDTTYTAAGDYNYIGFNGVCNDTVTLHLTIPPDSLIGEEVFEYPVVDQLNEFCNAELLDMSGTIRYGMKYVQIADSFFVRYDINFSNCYGIGESTQAKYTSQDSFIGITPAYLGGDLFNKPALAQVILPVTFSIPLGGNFGGTLYVNETVTFVTKMGLYAANIEPSRNNRCN